MTQPPLVRNVLFATDFSDASRLAGESAAAFARHFGARLHVLHVVPPVTVRPRRRRRSGTPPPRSDGDSRS